MKRSLIALLILAGSAAIQGCGGTETTTPAPTTSTPAAPGNPDTKSGPAGIDPSQK